MDDDAGVRRFLPRGLFEDAGDTHHGRPLWMFRADPDVVPLGSPDLLLSRFRFRVALLRDLALGPRARTPVTG